MIKNPQSNKTQHIIKKLIDTKLNIISNFNRYTELKEQLFLTKNLVHGDFHNENLLFSNEHDLLGILDFEESHYGHPTEDIIHFIQLACCNTGYHKSNLDKAKFFLREYLTHNHISNEHIRLGGYLYLYKIASSFFLEDKLLASDSDNLVPFLIRDLEKLEYLQHNMDELIENII